jgi:hypothetical protein
LFAVIAHTEMEPASLDERQLDHMVSVVRQSPGFLHGHWGRDTVEASKMHAVVLFERREDAQRFAAGVLDNLAGASLSVLEILTEA